MARTDMRPWRPGDRVVLRGQRWTVVEWAAHPDCETIRLASAAGSQVRTFVLPFDRPISQEPASTRLRVVRPRRALHHLRRTAARIHPYGGLGTAATSTIDLLPYQLAPALAMLRHGISRIVVADEAGLGKTIEAGLIAAELRARADSSRVLILAPAGLRGQWADELKARFDLDVVPADSTWLRRIGSELPPETNPWTLPEIYLASHDFVKRPEVLRPLEDVSWDLLIVDEAHGITSGTDRRSAIDAVARRSRRVVLLTATPHDSDASERAALVKIGAAAPGAPWIAFRRTRSIVAPGPERRSRILAVHPAEAERRMHRLLEDYTARVWREATIRGDTSARLASIILRKRALSSAASLALSVRRRMELLTDPPSADAFQLPLPLGEEDPLDDAEPAGVLGAPGLANTRRELRWLAAILEAARHASRHETKLQRLVALLRRIDEPAIVFTEYRDTLERLREALASRGIPAVLLHGGMSPAERLTAQDAFNRRAPLLLATDAAAEGLNLQARCRLVVHYELPWNPSRLEQRAGRVDRIGQRRRVHEVMFVADDTAERLVLEPIVARAREARRSRRGARLLRLLGESHVAAAVMGERLPVIEGTTAEDELAAHDFARCLPTLAVESEKEASRLLRHRLWVAQSPTSGFADERPVVSAPARLPVSRSAAFVHRLSLLTDDGVPRHAETVVVRVTTAPMNIGRSASDIRSAAERRQSEIGGLVDACVRRVAEARLAEISTMFAAAEERQHARNQELAAAAASAAQRMVQAGLFDKRQVRPIPPLLHSPIPPLTSPIPPLLHSSIPPLLHPSIRLVALLLLP